MGAFTGWLCVMAPEPRLVDIETGEVRKDRRTGATVYSVGVCGLRGRDSSVIQVSLVGEPEAVTVGAPVRLEGLEGMPWEREGRSGIAWRARSVHPLTAPAPTGPATTSAPAVPAAAVAGSGAAGRSGRKAGEGR